MKSGERDVCESDFELKRSSASFLERYFFINDQTNSKSQYLQESHNVRAGSFVILITLSMGQ